VKWGRRRSNPGKSNTVEDPSRDERLNGEASEEASEGRNSEKEEKKGKGKKDIGQGQSPIRKRYLTSNTVNNGES